MPEDKLSRWYQANVLTDRDFLAVVNERTTAALQRRAEERTFMSETTDDKILLDKTKDELQRKREQAVRILAATNTPISAMADILGIPAKKLRKQFRKQLKRKRARNFVNASIRMKLVNSAIGGKSRSMRDWLKQFGGLHK